MSFLASSLAAILLFIVSLFMYVIFSLTPTLPQVLNPVSKLTKLPGISLSTSYLGTRVLEYKVDNNVVYIGVSQDTYAGFVYAK